MEAGISAEALYNEGIKEYEEGQYDLAIENFKKAIEIDDSNFDYYFNLAAVYMAVEDYGSAIENFKKALEINSDDIEVYTNLGMAFYNNGEFENAAKAYKKTVWLNSMDPENFNNAGIAYCALKNFKEAANNFKHAVRIEPRDQNYNYNLAFACYGAGHYDLAEEYLVNVMNYDKQKEEGYVLLGKVYIKQQNYDLAKDTFEKLLSINPYHEEASAFIDKINARKPCEKIKIDDDAETTENEKETRKKLTDSEKQAKVEKYLNAAIILFKKKKYKAAITGFRKVLKLKKGHPEAVKNIKQANQKIKELNALFSEGLSHLKRNEYSEALNYLEKAQFIYPHSSKIEELIEQARVKNKEMSG